jgi:primosomal protein N' (replication factor Y)
VAGRAGRGEHPGEVVIQTHYPAHPLLRWLIERGYSAFAEHALREREAAGWPPFSYVAAVRAEAAREPDCFDFLESVRRIAADAAGGVTILGPAPSAMARQSGRFRGQIVLKSARRGPLHAVLATIAGRLRQARQARRVRWSIDVDPIEI